MSKRILILAGSPRKNGNSAALCRAFAERERSNPNRPCGKLMTWAARYNGKEKT